MVPLAFRFPSEPFSRLQPLAPALDASLGTRVWILSTLLLVASCDTGPREQVASAGSSAPSASANLQTGVAGHWLHGSVHSYQFELASELSIGAAQELTAFKLKGELELHVRRTGSGSYEFIQQIANPQFTATSSEQTQNFAKLAGELGAPFGFSTEGGKLSTVRVQPQWSQFAATISKTLASSFQGPTVETVEEREWTVAEVDSSGPYKAIYKRTATGLSKRKLDYETVKHGGAELGSLKAVLSPSVEHSSGSLLFSSAGALTTFNYEETLRVPMGATATLVSQTTLRLTPSSRPVRKLENWNEVLADTTTLSSTAPHPNPIQPDFDPLRIGDYTYKTALLEIRKLQASPDDPSILGTPEGRALSESERQRYQRQLQDRARPFRAMAAILRTQPEHIPHAVAEIKKRDHASRTMIDALVSARTDESLEALVQLLENPTFDIDWRGAVASGLARTKHSTPRSVAALTAALQEPKLRVHALYGLGSIARRLAESGEQAQAEQITLTLVNQLRATNPTAVRIHALHGLSNAGVSSTLPAIIPLLEAESEGIRAAAAQALRLIEHPQVDALLAEILLKDQNKRVRKAAAESVAVRKSSEVLITALQNVVTSDPDVKVRRLALETLGKWAPEHPEVRKSIELVAAEDARLSVREEAREIRAKLE